MLLLYFFGVVVLTNCAFYLLFSKFSFFNFSEIIPSETPPISLIVCAKNEEKNLEKHIPLWLEQEYPNFELILINDASADDTLDMMERFAETDPRIKIVNVKNNEAFWGNKKYALTLGIKKAVNDRLIFTDADCRPASSEWLGIMSSHLSQEKQLVLGYGAYSKCRGLLNKLIRFETLLTATQYLSYALVGNPYMGVGRNLAYTSKLFYEHKGFMSHIKISSGDDDLFVNEAASKSNTAVCIAENAFTYSIPKKTWESWMLQKKRHVTTASLYKRKHKVLLGLYYIANLLFWLLGGVLFFIVDWKIPLALILFRFLIQYIVIGKVAKRLKEKDLIAFIPFFELFLVFIQLSIFISSSGSKQTRWK